MIKAVLFDFGGVLTQSGKRGFIASTVADLYGIPLDQVDIDDLHRMLRRGEGTDEMFFDELNRRFNGTATKEMFLARADVGSDVSPEVYGLAQSMRDHGIKTGILSNVFAMSAERLREQGRYEGFDPIILSYEEGYAKPEEELYRIAIQKTGVGPHEILFIDDQERCIVPAQEMGMHTIRAVSPEQIVADTKALILKENNIVL